MKHYEEIEKTLSKIELTDRHSYFQLKYFVIGKEPTIQSQLWRCLRELKTRMDSFESIKAEIEDQKDELIILELSQNIENLQEIKEIQEIRKKKHLRKIELVKKHIIELERKQKFTEEEAEFFYLAYKSLITKEPLQPYDDIKSQEEYWNEKLSQDLNMKLLLRHPIDTELVKTIMALGEHSPTKKYMMNLLTVLEQEAKNKSIEHKKEK